MWTRPELMILIFAVGAIFFVIGILGVVSELFPKFYTKVAMAVCALGLAIIVIPIVIQFPVILMILAIFIPVVFLMYRLGLLPRIK